MKKLFIEMYRWDGPGTIIQRILSAHAFCLEEGYKFGGIVSDIKKTYWHTPLFYRKMEDFFGIKMEKRDSRRGLKIGKEDFSDDGSESVVYDENFIQRIVENNVDKYFNDSWRKKILEHMEIIPGEKKKIISVHVRRGDVDKQEFPNRFLDDQVYIDIVDDIVLKNENCQVNLFSQKPFNGNLDIYIRKYRKENRLRIFLDDTPKASSDEGLGRLLDSIMGDWKKMIGSDFLVMSRSGFSYVPALLCIGKVYYAPFWHKKLKDWITYQI